MSEKENKPLILSLETSGKTCSVVASLGDSLLADFSVYGGNLHDKLNAALVQNVFSALDIGASDLDAVALSAGPGSFTGLRIGASIAKALCFDESGSGATKFIAVPTLSAIAFSALEAARKLGANYIVPAVPAQRDILYRRKFDLHFNALTEAEVLEYDEFKAELTGDAFYCGPYAEKITEGVSLADYSRLSGKFIAKLAQKMFAANDFANPDSFTPHYIQEFKPKTRRKGL